MLQIVALAPWLWLQGPRGRKLKEPALVCARRGWAEPSVARRPALRRGPSHWEMVVEGLGDRARPAGLRTLVCT